LPELIGDFIFEIADDHATPICQTMRRLAPALAVTDLTSLTAIPGAAGGTQPCSIAEMWLER
jgi:hypothetical protein